MKMKPVFLSMMYLMFLVATSQAQEKLFVVPANKAYAEPFETYESGKAGVRIPVGYPEDGGDVSHWTDKNRQVVWYLYQTAGEYAMQFEHTVSDNKKIPFQLVVSACYDGLNFKSEKHNLTLAGTGKKEKSNLIEVKINKTGYYRYALTAHSDPSNAIRIHHLLFSSKGKDSQVNQTDYQSSPSVHINFTSTGPASKSYNWLYEEVQVPKGADPLYTFYMAIGFYRGYLGIQTNSETERRVLFSVWDSKDAENDKSIKHDDYVKLVDKARTTTTNSFGGEGTGGQSYVKSANWKTGETVSFIMNVLPQDNNSVVLSAWYKLQGQATWNYIASWRTPKEHRYFDGFHSFLENFGYDNGQYKRMAEYFNAFGYEHQDGKWVHLNKVSFSNTDGKVGQRVDYEQGVSPLHKDRFYMSSGGYSPTVKTDHVVPLLKTGPEVDLTVLEQRVQKALDNEKLRKN